MVGQLAAAAAVAAFKLIKDGCQQGVACCFCWQRTYSALSLLIVQETHLPCRSAAQRPSGIASGIGCRASYARPLPVRPGL